MSSPVLTDLHRRPCITQVLLRSKSSHYAALPCHLATIPGHVHNHWPAQSSLDFKVPLMKSIKSIRDMLVGKLLINTNYKLVSKRHKHAAFCLTAEPWLTFMSLRCLHQSWKIKTASKEYGMVASAPSKHPHDDAVSDLIQSKPSTGFQNTHKKYRLIPSSLWSFIEILSGWMKE